MKKEPKPTEKKTPKAKPKETQTHSSGAVDISMLTRWLFSVPHWIILSVSI